MLSPQQMRWDTTQGGLAKTVRDRKPALDLECADLGFEPADLVGAAFGEPYIVRTRRDAGRLRARSRDVEFFDGSAGGNAPDFVDTAFGERPHPAHAQVLDKGRAMHLSKHA
jgi:hypothetical protein